MKLAHPALNTPIDWEEYYINTFVIENSKMYRDFITEMYNQCMAEPGDFVLSEGLTILDFHKNVEFIGTLYNMKDGKKFSTAIIKELTEIANNEEVDLCFELYGHINNVISELIFFSGKDLVFDEINDVSQLLKLYNVRPEFDCLPLAEKMLLYMQLCEKYLKKKVFVFVELHSWFSKEEIELIFKDIVYNKYRVFIIERYDMETSKHELKRIIDIDLCEI